MLAQVRPYRLGRQTSAALEQAITEVDPPLASAATTDAKRRKLLKGDLDAILNRALKKEPTDRYATVDALAQDIERYLRGVPVQARQQGFLHLRSPSGRRCTSGSGR